MGGKLILDTLVIQCVVSDCDIAVSKNRVRAICIELIKLCFITKASKKFTWRVESLIVKIVLCGIVTINQKDSLYEYILYQF